MSVNDETKIARTWSGKKILWWVTLSCFAFELFLVLTDLILVYFDGTDIRQIRHIFKITREDNLATWFATSQALMVGLTLWAVFLLSSYKGEQKRKRVGWGVLAAFFTYISIDDGSKLHERVASAIHRNADSLAWLFDFFPSYSWQVTFLPFFIAVGIYMVFFLRKELSQRWQYQLIILALACFAIAVGLDYVDGLGEKNMEKMALTWGFHEGERLLHLFRLVEETLEMMGTTLFWTVFLGQLFSMISSLRIQTRDHTELTISIS